MKIRSMKKSEIAIASKIMAKNYTKKVGKYAVKLLQSMFKGHAYKPHYLVAEEKGEIKGFIGYAQSWMNFRLYQVFLFNVAPEHQSKGIGTQLLKRAIAKIKAQKGHYKEGFLILLTTPIPVYYSKRFGFKTILRFRKKEAHLMVLDIER